MKFIEKIVDDLVQTQVDLGRIAVVFPSRRAKVFFEKCLQMKGDLPKPLWAPDVFSIQDFVERLAQKRFSDDVTLLFRLYDVYRRQQPEKPLRTFDDFYQWGTMLLDDFGEVEEHLIDSKALFENLKNIAGIAEYEGADRKNKGSRTKQREERVYGAFIRFAEMMGALYDGFNEELERTGETYYKRAARELQESLARGQVNLDRWALIAFAGFNALTPVEEKIVQAVIKTGKGKIYWDMDTYFMKGGADEAGKYFRNSRLIGKKPKWDENLLAEGAREIEVIGAAGSVSQAKICGAIIEKQPAAAPEETVVVLPDESLLFPVLCSLPERVKDINVTMGFPLRQTPIYTLLSAIIELHENPEKLKRPDEFYHKDVERVLLHPYVRMMERKGQSPFIRTMRAEKRIFLQRAQFSSMESAPVRELFVTTISGIDGFLEYILSLLRNVRAVLAPGEEEQKTPSIELEYVYSLFTVVQRLQDAIKGSQVELKVATFWRLLRQMIDGSRIPFVGEPLRGLQIMGLLETRALDFKNVIFLSANEGVLPPGKHYHSFIPFDIRRMLRLSTYEDHDAVAAYHFYRLLRRAEKVYLLYNTEQDEIGKAGKSRFLEQFLYEYEDWNKHARVSSSVRSLSARSESPKAIRIEKTPAILQVLKELQFSPSSLSSYLDCSLRFFFQKVLGVKEREEVVEGADAGKFGIIMHAVLKELYEPYRGKILELDDVRAMNRRRAEQVEASFKRTLNVDALAGKNLVLVEVAKKLIGDFFEEEERYLPVEVLDVENDRWRASVRFAANASDYTAGLGGRIDRLDRKSGITRIVDYKTGTVDSLTFDRNVLEGELPDSKEFIETLAKKKEEVQLLTYFYLVASNCPPDGKDTFEFAVYDFKKRQYRLLKTPNSSERFILATSEKAKVERLLGRILAQIFDTSGPFQQSADQEKCEYCPYKDICCR